MNNAGVILTALTLIVALFVGIGALLLVAVWLLWVVFGPPEDM